VGFLLSVILLNSDFAGNYWRLKMTRIDKDNLVYIPIAIKGEDAFDQSRLECYDSGDEYPDRYTVIDLKEIEKITDDGTIYAAWSASSNPFHPLGIGCHTEAMRGEHLGKIIEFSDLPDDVQRFVKQDFSTEKNTVSILTNSSQ
jgi:hypothetical protein